MAALAIVFWSAFGLVMWNWREAVAEREAKEEQRLKASIAGEEARLARDRALDQEQKARAAAERADRSLYSGSIDRARLERQSANIAESDAILDRCEPARRGWEWHFLKGLNHAELLNLSGHGEGAWIESVAYSPDGKRIATAGGGDPFYRNRGQTARPGTVVIWDAESGRPEFTLREHKHLLSQVAFSPGGRLWGSASLDGTIKIHESATGKLIQTIVAGKPEPAGHGRWMPLRTQLVAFTPDGKSVASNTAEHTYAIWDIATGVHRLLLPVVEEGHRRASIAPDGRYLATLTGVSNAAGYGEVHLWNAATGAELNRPENNRDHFCLAFSPDGGMLAGGGSGFVSLWNPADGKLRRVLTGHEGRVLGIAFRPDGAAPGLGRRRPHRSDLGYRERSGQESDPWAYPHRHQPGIQPRRGPTCHGFARRDGPGLGSYQGRRNGLR